MIYQERTVAQSHTHTHTHTHTQTHSCAHTASCVSPDKPGAHRVRGSFSLPFCPPLSLSLSLSLSLTPPPPPSPPPPTHHLASRNKTRQTIQEAAPDMIVYIHESNMFITLTHTHTHTHAHNRSAEHT